MLKRERLELFFYKKDFNYIPVDNYLVNLLYRLFIKEDTSVLKITSADSNFDVYKGVYYKLKNDMLNAVKYYEIAIKKNNTYAMLNMAYLYEEANQKYAVKKYLEMAAHQNNVDAIFRLGKYYNKENDLNNMKKYYLMGAKLGNNKCVLAINNYLKKKFDLEIALEFYNWLDQPNLKKINTHLITYQKLLVNSGLDTKEDCSICYEQNLILSFPCKHRVCINCYDKIKKTCPLCRRSI